MIGLLLCMLPLASAWAATVVPVVSSIAVQGNRFVDTAAVMADIHSQVGKPLDRRQISRDVRKLFASGMFRDLSVEGVRSADKVKLIYHVVENPVIGKITFEGNDAVDNKVLKRIIKLKAGHVFSPESLQRERMNLRHQYLKKGHYQVVITFKQNKNSDGSIDLVIHIVEGPVTRIRRIRFIGNDAFDIEILRGVLASRESTLMGWFSDRDVFSRKRSGADGQMLMQYYLNHGYLDAKVESTILSITEDKRAFYLTFNLHEGIQYRVSKVILQGDLVPSKAALEKKVALAKGAIYSLKNLRTTIDDITERVGDEGYAFATVTPMFKRNPEAKTVAITLDIEKGKKVYVERIDISGNDDTDDAVVRREMRQGEGARYSASRVKRSKKRLNRLGLFKDVKVTMPRGSAPDKVKMNVKVTEKKTGKFTFGVGYSQLEKVFLTTSLQQQNFLGKGINTNVSATIGARTQNYNIGVTDPFFMGHEVSATVNTFKTQTKLASITQYKQNDIGGGVSFGFPLSEQVSYSLGYSFSQTNLSDVPTTSSIILRAQQGKHTQGEITQSIAYDSRDRTLAAHTGQIDSVGFGMAGLGGNRRFMEFSASHHSYLALGDKFTFSPQLEGRYIAGYGGRPVPLERRYSMGGMGSLRGFDSYGVSIRDPKTGDPVGGNGMVRGALDLFFPLPGVRTDGFRGVIFYEMGTVWGHVNSTFGGIPLSISQPFAVANLRSSTGFGIEWLSPVGPVALIWGKALRKKPGDLTRSFEFALGANF
ncbi:MAG: outer membrane protein assembly factor BamA [Mariprofundales bacterium]|nr:outer membrane protein assembly factor BamA [Mariprofundales bacterium]